MEPQLETLLEAEVYFYRAMNTQGADAPSYEDFQRFAGAVDFAYNRLSEMTDANKKLEDAKRKGMLRQEREGIPNQVLPIKTAILTGSAQAQIAGLRGTACADPDLFSGLYQILRRYDFEIGYRVLQAYNSLLELESGLCAPVGSVLCLVEPKSGEVIHDGTGQPANLRYDPPTGRTHDSAGKKIQ